MKFCLLGFIIGSQLLVNVSTAWLHGDEVVDILYTEDTADWDNVFSKTNQQIGKRQKRSLGDTSTSIPENETEAEAEPLSESEYSNVSNVTSESETVPDSEPGSTTTKWIFIGIYVFLMVGILICNGCIILAITKCKRLRTSTNLYILSLSISDICIAAFVIPGVISAKFSEAYMIIIICKLCHYASHLAMAAASLSLAAIAVDRLRSIAWPLKPKFTRKEVGLILATLWLFASIYSIRAPLLFTLTEVSVDGETMPEYICGVPAESSTNRPLIVLDFIIVLFIPAVMITVSYVTMTCVLMKNRRNVQNMQSTGNKNNKALRMSVLVTAVFIICHLPVQALRLYFASEETITSASLKLMPAFDVLSFINSVLNPFLYGFLNQKIRNGFVEVTCLSRSARRRLPKGGQNKIHPQSNSKTDLSNIATVIEPSTFTTPTTVT